MFRSHQAGFERIRFGPRIHSIFSFFRNSHSAKTRWRRFPACDTSRLYFLRRKRSSLATEHRWSPAHLRKEESIFGEKTHCEKMKKKMIRTYGEFTVRMQNTRTTNTTLLFTQLQKRKIVSLPFRNPTQSCYSKLAKLQTVNENVDSQRR